MALIRFFVAGLPKSMSVGRSVVFQKASGPRQHFQKRINTEWAVLVGHMGRLHAPAAPLEGPLIFTARFYLPRPGGLPKKVSFPVKRPDIDNLVHKLTDEFSGVFYRDDSQIVDLVVSKRFAGNGHTGVEIFVETTS